MNMAQKTLDIVIAMLLALLQRGERAQRFQMSDLRYSLEQFFDPNNPFIPWILMLELLILLAHLYIIFWVYRDALQRYNRGAPWAALAAFFPIGGWMFYLLYRNSQLVEFDRIEAETFDETEPQWTDYDNYRANQSTKWFRDIRALWGGEASGYSPWVRASRLREQRGTLTPAEKEARRKDALAQRAQRKAESQQLREERQVARREKKKSAREARIKTGAHGIRYRMSRGRERRLERDLSLVGQLRQLPREDKIIEELIYEMDYVEALKAAHDGLAISSEMGDLQGEITYKGYIERIERLLEDESEELDGTQLDNMPSP
jgi:hypothetical protein